MVEQGTLPGRRPSLSTLARSGARVTGVRAPAITLVGAGRRAARAARLARDAAAVRAHRRGHARARAGERARRAAARAGRDGGRGAGDPYEPLPVELPDVRAYDLLCVTSPNGADAALRRACATRGRWPASRWPRSARGPRGRCARTASRPTSCPSAPWPRGWSRRWRSRRCGARSSRARPRARDVLPDALRERGAEVDVLALYETVAEPLDDDARAARRGRGLHLFTSASSVRFFAPRAARSTARGSSRSAPPPAPSCAATASSPTSRPTRTRPTAWSPRCSRDAAMRRHVPLRLRRRATSSSASSTP